jgi:hypothetical protein
VIEAFQRFLSQGVLELLHGEGVEMDRPPDLQHRNAVRPDGLT